MQSVFDLTTPMSLEKTIAVYEYCRPMMPALKTASTTPHHASRLRDLFSDFDALLLDGFGVLNVGADRVPEADQMVTAAQDQGLTVMVLTNGASKEKSTAALKYHTLDLPIDPSHVISSRDALLHQLDQSAHHITRFGVVDSYTDIPAGYPFDCRALSPEAPQDWLTCDAIGFFGAVHWHEGWQDALKAAMKAGVQIMVANPDVTAPLQGGFSREPGFWVAKAVHDLGLTPQDAPVSWFGKPYPAVYDLALARLEDISGHSILDRKRIAMVGDTLHTDILGGLAAGLSSVLITGHGLFRHGGAEDIMNKTGIIPDYITDTV